MVTTETSLAIIGDGEEPQELVGADTGASLGEVPATAGIVECEPAKADSSDLRSPNAEQLSQYHQSVTEVNIESLETLDGLDLKIHYESIQSGLAFLAVDTSEIALGDDAFTSLVRRFHSATERNKVPAVGVLSLVAAMDRLVDDEVAAELLDRTIMTDWDSTVTKDRYDKWLEKLDPVDPTLRLRLEAIADETKFQAVAAQVQNEGSQRSSESLMPAPEYLVAVGELAVARSFVVKAA